MAREEFVRNRGVRDLVSWGEKEVGGKRRSRGREGGEGKGERKGLMRCRDKFGICCRRGGGSGRRWRGLLMGYEREG